MSDAITGLSSMATRAVLAELAAAFEAREGRPVAIRSLGGVDAAKLVRAGEPVDIVVLASGVMDALDAEGHLVPGSRAGVARSRVALAVPAGAPRPALDDEDAVRRAILAGGRIGVSTGPSGDQLRQAWTRWGIAEAVAGRLVQAPPGVSVGSLLAKGEADLGFQQLSEFVGVPGIDIVGCLPAGMNCTTLFTAGLSRHAAGPDAARTLIAFLASPATADAKRRHGLEPA